MSNKQELIWQSEAIRGHNEKTEEQRREISMERWLVWCCAVPADTALHLEKQQKMFQCWIQSYITASRDCKDHTVDFIYSEVKLFSANIQASVCVQTHTQTHTTTSA